MVIRRRTYEPLGIIIAHDDGSSHGLSHGGMTILLVTDSRLAV